MSSTRRLLPLLLVLGMFLQGCITQSLALPALDADGEPGEAFENSGYSAYVLFDLIKVSEASVTDLIAEVNPERRPIHSVKVTSQQDFLSWFLNILNGGIIDRGVLFSMNKVTVKGRFSKSR
ncbi:MAG: hypothetical protein ACE5F1_16670 [Planctomycetota bacterium]